MGFCFAYNLYANIFEFILKTNIGPAANSTKALRISYDIGKLDLFFTLSFYHLLYYIAKVKPVRIKLTSPVVPIALVDPARIELASPRCKRGVLPLYQGPTKAIENLRINLILLNLSGQTMLPLYR